MNRSCRILVVDDHRDARESLVTVLELLGHRAVSCHDGDTALGALRGSVTCADAFMLAIVDVSMPTMSGYDLVATIRGESAISQIYIAALTGWGSASERAQALDAGFDTHLAKPIGVDEIRALIAVACARG